MDSERRQSNQFTQELQDFVAAQQKPLMRFSRVTTEEEMRECQEISQALFGVGRDTVPERMKLLARNPDAYHMLHREQEVIGYVAVMPVRPERLATVLYQTLPVYIDPEDIDDFKGDKKIDVYLHAMGIRPEFGTAQKRLYGSRLVSGLMNMIIDWGRNGVEIGVIVARSNTPDGIRLLKHLGFTETKPLTPECRTFIIDVQTSHIPYILRYRRTLEGSRK